MLGLIKTGSLGQWDRGQFLINLVVDTVCTADLIYLACTVSGIAHVDIGIYGIAWMYVLPFVLRIKNSYTSLIQVFTED